MSVTFRVGELFPNFDSLMSKTELPSSAGSLKVSCSKTLHDEGRCLNHCLLGNDQCRTRLSNICGGTALRIETGTSLPGAEKHNTNQG